MARPMLWCGSITSEPLLAMVVKPLKAKMPSAVAPRKFPTVPDSLSRVKSIARLSASKTPTRPIIRMPPIFSMPINPAKPWIRRLPSRLITKAVNMSATPSIGTIRPDSSPPNSCIVYEPNVRAKKLWAMTIEKYINKALNAVGNRSP